MLTANAISVTIAAKNMFFTIISTLAGAIVTCVVAKVVAAVLKAIVCILFVFSFDDTKMQRRPGL